MAFVIHVRECVTMYMFVYVHSIFNKHQCRILILPGLICLGCPGTEAYNGAVTFLQLEPSFRSRFSKYLKPKRGIGPGSSKTGAK